MIIIAEKSGERKNQLKRLKQEKEIQNRCYLTAKELSENVIFEYDRETDTIFFPKKIRSFLNGKIVWEHAKRLFFHTDMIYPEDKKSFLEICNKLFTTGQTWECEFRTKFFTGEYRWFEVVFAAVQNEEKKVVKLLGKLTDIEEQKRHLLELQNSAKLDSITGLYHKKAIFEFMEERIAKQQAFAVLVVDIDNFNQIGHTMGNLFSDSVLCTVADGIQETTGNLGTVGRIGTGEFLVVLESEERETVQKTAIDLSGMLRKVYIGGEEDFYLTASIGIARYPQDGKETEDVFSRASEALYTIKNSGKNRFLFADQMGKLETPSLKTESSIYNYNTNWFRRQAEHFSQSMISFVFNVLASAKSLPSAINLVLDRIGKTYELDRIQIMRASYTNRSMQVSYLWEEQVQQVKEEEVCFHFQSWEEMLSGFDERGMIIAKDCETANLTADFQRTIKERKAKAVVSCGLYDVDGEFLGMILFEDSQKVRDWELVELDTFLEFSKIMSYFILTNASRKRDSMKIEQLSNYDKVTGLHSYRQFKKDLARILKKCGTMGRLALLNMDISNFKYVNSAFGIEAGDCMLRDFARFFVTENTSCISGCRIFADDFLAVVKMESKEKLEEQIKRQTEEFIRREYKKNAGSYFSVHTGIYEILPEDRDANYVIDCAIMARKTVKRRQESQYQFFDDALREQVIRESRVLAVAHKAIRQEELIPYLQPKFDLETKQLTGAEALVRWKQNGKICFYPNDFIPVLEQSGDIVELDFSIYEQVLRTMRRWQEEGKQLFPISINISRVHCKFDSCDQRIIQLADQYQISHKWIEVEITESAFLDDTNILVENLERLRNAGFRISIDDFGSGYSSLSIISQMPVDVIKMDQTFITKALDQERTGCVIAAMISMARNLNLDVICEGVETEEQAQFLLERGCRTGQGYLFSKPISITEFEEKYL
ncbi:MAG: EAL domain-containing protein [Lachnospiraceae bacterium]|nr:EAL domain-containing protein [Lachnospiraceae bacterium]